MAKAAVKNYTDYKLDQMLDEFRDQAKLFAVMMFGTGVGPLEFNGGGLDCYDMPDCLRRMYILWVKIKSFEAAKRVVLEGKMD